jgi:hypothetical protein
MAARRGAVQLAACGIFLLSVGGAYAQVPFDGGRGYNQCANDAYRRAGPPPRGTPRPGDDLAMLERRRQEYEDRYYSALDQCLRDAERQRVRRN